MRQDLALLEKRSYINRGHGYATAVNVDRDDVDSRMMVNFNLKQKLAHFAASLVEDGETVFLESGSTNALLARLLAERSNITIITVSHYIANLLKDTSCEVILLGGQLQKKSETVVGPLTRQCIQQVHFSKAFIGIDGYRPDTGFTGRDMMRADVVNAVLSKGADNIIITDATKFGQIHPHSLSPMSEIRQVITDTSIDRGYLADLTASGIQVRSIESQASGAPSLAARTWHIARGT